VIVDFGSDASFIESSKKIKEHYGIELPSSSIRKILTQHAHIINKSLEKIQPKDKPHGKIIIGESDGSMIPIVKFDENIPGDRRKTRATLWAECRLNLAYAQGDIIPKYSATLGSTNEAGRLLAYAADMVGRDEKNLIHCIGDGAPWIAEQVEVQFGSQANYLLDFYHLSGYLHKAAGCLSPDSKDAWAALQKQRMKNNEINAVLQDLENHLNQQTEAHSCEARTCYNYMTRRMKQFNYKDALTNKLPIGSGEIESGHRSVIQKRLKQSGGWWLKENAQAVVSLRVLRANGFFENYWAGLKVSEFTTHA
jgi:hypothetical protein